MTDGSQKALAVTYPAKKAWLSCVSDKLTGPKNILKSKFKPACNNIVHYSRHHGAEFPSCTTALEQAPNRSMLWLHTGNSGMLSSKPQIRVHKTLNNLQTAYACGGKKSDGSTQSAKFISITNLRKYHALYPAFQRPASRWN